MGGTFDFAELYRSINPTTSSAWYDGDYGGGGVNAEESGGTEIISIFSYEVSKKNNGSLNFFLNFNKHLPGNRSSR